MGFDAKNITKKEFDEIKKRAMCGEVEFQYKLARVYDLYDSEYVAFNPKEAFKYYKLAADQGHMLAQMYVGYCYEMGEGIDKDIDMCVKYYNKSADQGNTLAEQAALKYKTW